MTAHQYELVQREERLWTYEEPLRYRGIEMGRIMSIMRLSSGGLFIHSPAELTPQLQSALDDLGEVQFVASASNLHGHLYMEDYKQAYPNVELLAAPGLATRRDDLAFDYQLGDTPDPRWGTDVDHRVLQGHRLLHELAFFHRPSRTLILGDFGFHIGESSPLMTQFIARLAGIYQQVGPPIDIRLTVKNRAALRRSLQDILAWDFDRLVPGHGEIIETDGRRALLDGFDWLLPTG